MSTETAWHDADRDGRQQGPLSRDDFLRMLERERLQPDCALELTLHAPGQSMLDGKRVWLAMDEDAGTTPTWHCSSERRTATCR